MQEFLTNNPTHLNNEMQKLVKRCAYKVGDVLEGVVKDVWEFGIFVALPSINMTGLLYVNEISWENDGFPTIFPDEVFKIGDKVKVVILQMKDDGSGIYLGYKQLTDKPKAHANADNGSESI